MVNINGLEEINGENYPLDIWSLYMQGVVQGLPVEQLDTPSPDLKLRIKTGGYSYEKPGATTGRTRETTIPGFPTSRSTIPRPPVYGQPLPPQPPTYGPPVYEPPSQQPPIYGRPQQPQPLPPVYGQPWQEQPTYPQSQPTY